ncbi:winged helix-turn-helix domain-containing protein [Actinoplanes flavus]|uniref:Helix-turn-helix transcriptional regulator n=1 Tax=Actinoplanes flavus TaxID=2820290 RepID=A0ABS3UU23_9ACTN|nr:helix-turn-helix domain-containing protein [Actinoplanes flavus]MBO3742093.1 helix-turn-helix transcriptional regulator [Actinoplanes flavus]
MSLGDVGSGGTAALRALAHPIRLRIMSLLTGASLTAAEVARELGITHANASYHLRNLLSGGLIVVAGEEKIRGGVAKRYRYDAVNDRGPLSPEEKRALYPAAAQELIRRSATSTGPGVLGDAELWVDPDRWTEIRDRIAAVLLELHELARPPRTPGTIRTSTTVVLFEMEAE